MTGSDRRGDGQKVLVAGAGVAGLEAALALRDLAGDRVDIALHDPSREFSYRPFGIGEPYGTTRAFRYDLRSLSELCGASLHASAISAVEPEQRIAVTRDGERHPYDHLIVATGARMLWAVPGAATYWGVADEGQVGDLIADLRLGRLRRLALTMPPGHSWVLPLYELALLAANVLDKTANDRTRITVVTPEAAPLEIFGPRAAEQTSALLAERQVDVIAGARPISFASGRLRIDPGDEVEADAVIALPRLEGRRIGGIPHDEDGFIAVDEHGGAVGMERIYAAGDVSSLFFKQGAFASQQADTVAEAIAAAAGAEVEPRAAGPRMRAVLWTAQGPRYFSGRNGEDEERGSSPSQRHLELLHNGRLTARYLSPLVDSLLAGNGSHSAERSATEAPQRV
ncbi:MAG TPA: FAD-dependent oxidoreductase [Solirubrobacterales bacterium]|jgi:sulfide:quinone oxidoreductase|nr:FAD-dependent oxidoreductase [Solirubrobacterales bacterium]